MKNSWMFAMVIVMFYSGLAFGECQDLSGKWALVSCSVGESDISAKEFKVVKQSQCTYIGVRHENAEGKSYLQNEHEFGVERSNFTSGGSPYQGSKMIDFAAVTHGAWTNEGRTLLVQEARGMVNVELAKSDDWVPAAYASLSRYTLENNLLEIEVKNSGIADSKSEHSVCEYSKVR